MRVKPPAVCHTKKMTPQVSRQRKWQLKMRKLGRCQICGRESRTTLCPAHKRKKKKSTVYSRMPEATKQKFRDRANRWAARYPERTMAHRIVSRAIKAGYLEREACEKCGNGRADAHHEDYAKPLDVVWLCRSCHATLHRARKYFSD